MLANEQFSVAIHESKPYFKTKNYTQIYNFSKEK